MKNIINYDIDFGKIPLSIKKYLYIHNDIYSNLKINKKSNEEILIKINNNEIICEPFWNDKLTYTGNKELDSIINLEEREMKEYLKKNPNFGIIVRKKVKNKLLKINKELKKMGYYLSIKIGYRPFKVQKKLFETIFSYFKEKNKGESIIEIYNKTIEMISDPNKYISPHLTGGAVDVVLYKKGGKLVDMGCPVNYIGEKAYLTTNNITKKQKKNRDILTDIFLKHGFSCLASEWWHFSYGDPYWAKFYGKKEALYGMYNSPFNY